MNKLIYGKNIVERVVSVEVNDSNAELFIQDENGDIQVEVVPNKFWLLSNKPYGPNWATLKGNLHYRYGKQFATKEELLKQRNILSQQDTYMIWDEREALMVKDGYTLFKGMRPSEPSTLSFDIESTSLEHNNNAKVLLISNTFRKNGKIERRLFAYNDYADEGEMIEDWCTWVREKDPSIITGHNIVSYDLPYLNYIAEKYAKQLLLGRDGSTIRFNKKESAFRVDGNRDLNYRRCRIYGREIIDTMFLAYKYDFSRKYESYGLKPIIKHEGLEVKDRQFYDASQIRYKYKDPVEWELIKKYTLHDADDALALFDLMAPSYFYMTQSIPKSFQGVVESASGSQINSIMVRSYLQEGHSVPKASEVNDFEGAISLGNPGIYRNVFKVDVASLYPSIILDNQIYDKFKDPKHNFLVMAEFFTKERLNHKSLYKTTKDKYHDDMQASMKIFINSCYGFMSTAGLNFNSPGNAALVTRKGREILERSFEWCKSKGYILANADTDSIAFCKEDQVPFTTEEQETLLEDLNSLYSSTIHWEHDGIYEKFIVLKTKNYILWDGKKLKDKGSSLKSATLEPKLKQFLKDIINAIITDQTNYQEIYYRYVKEINNITDIKPWCSKKTLSATTYESDRENEAKIIRAIEGTEYVEGDKVYVFYKSDDTLCLAEKFDGDYHKDRFWEKLFKSTERFATIINTKELFPNFKLKRNKALLEEILK